MRSYNNRKIIISIIFSVFISLLASLNMLKNVDRAFVHIDEPGWISSGYYYSNLLLAGDFEWQQWKCPQCESFGSEYNPHLGQWAIGIPLKVFALKGEQEFDTYNSEESLETNKRKGEIPPKSILLRARLVSVVIGILCCLMIFHIGYYSNNLWIGSIASILLMFNSLFVDLSTLALTDIEYNFLLLCACFVSIFFLRQSKRLNILLISLLYGGVIGLAASVKITGIVFGTMYFFMIIGYKKIAGNLKVQGAVKCLIAFAISALCVIYILNPYFWPSLTQINIQKTTEEVVTYFKKQPEPVISEKNPRIEYPQLSNLSHVLEFPVMFSRVSHLMDEQLKTNKSWGWGDNRLRSFHKEFLTFSSGFPKESKFLWIGIILEIYFLGLGIIILCRKLIKSIYSQKLSEQVIPFLYFATNYVFIVLFMKLNWDRYYLPTVIASQMIVATGIYETIRLIRSIRGRSMTGQMHRFLK
jgi:4-amino-4-deoxy-L-arabinose transferase-like glycosyltransferase